jgi:hypothetical protein
MIRQVVVVIGACFLASCGPSDSEFQEATQACEEFLAKELSRGGGSLETHVFDKWTKNGAIVLEVGYREKYTEKAYSSRKCVFDKKNGRLSSPSPLNDREWAKS